MTAQNHTPSEEEENKAPVQETSTPPSAPEQKKPTPLRTRILALIGVAFMIFLVIMYTYSMATGKIFAW